MAKREFSKANTSNPTKTLANKERYKTMKPSIKFKIITLLLVPLMPRLDLAIIVLLARFSISQMDVPTRQAYVMAVVDPSERTAAAGITGVARTTGAALAPVLAMPLIASSTHDWVPFVAAGALKIVYDLVLLWSFKSAD